MTLQDSFHNGIYSKIPQEVRKEVNWIKQMSKKDEVMDKIINNYFLKPEKTLKEVFEE